MGRVIRKHYADVLCLCDLEHGVHNAFVRGTSEYELVPVLKEAEDVPELAIRFNDEVTVLVLVRYIA